MNVCNAGGLRNREYGFVKTVRMRRTLANSIFWRTAKFRHDSSGTNALLPEPESGAGRNMGFGVDSTASMTVSLCSACVLNSSGGLIISLGLSLSVNRFQCVPIDIEACDAWLAG